MPVADDVTGGIPSLQLQNSSTTATLGYCIDIGSGGCAPRDLTAFKNGHLQFDARLESPLVTSISINLFPSLTVQIPIASLNQTTFVHQSIALTPDLFGTNGPPVNQVNVFKISITASAASNGQLMLTLNDIKWTSN